jgi:hypothetical protein
MANTRFISSAHLVRVERWVFEVRAGPAAGLGRGLDEFSALVPGTTRSRHWAARRVELEHVRAREPVPAPEGQVVGADDGDVAVERDRRTGEVVGLDRRRHELGRDPVIADAVEDEDSAHGGLPSTSAGGGHRVRAFAEGRNRPAAEGGPARARGLSLG